MKLDYTFDKIARVLGYSDSNSNQAIYSVAYDSRKIVAGEHVLFFALIGSFRDGHEFVAEAYSKGVRHFVVSKTIEACTYPDAHFIRVEDTLNALEKLAIYHRKSFTKPVIGITGSYGKTTVKEWLSNLLMSKFNVVRSPKSYNSRLGVALSVLELYEGADLAIIEAGISKAGDMEHLQKMIQPTHGILTTIGKTDKINFSSEEEHIAERLFLFKDAATFLYPSDIELKAEKGIPVDSSVNLDLLDHFNTVDSKQRQNLSLAIEMAQKMGVSKEQLLDEISKLRPLSLRLEVFDGKNNCTIINDAYHLDLDSLHYALEYQLAHSDNKKRIVVIGLTNPDEKLETEIRSIAKEFELEKLIFHYPGDAFDFSHTNACILFKGTRDARSEFLAHEYREHRHQTYLEINQTAIRKNIEAYISNLNDETKLLCMIKASSYGSNAKKMSTFLEDMGADYLGVAYPHEGVELRENGITLPILVMNSQPADFDTCIWNRLEPAIFSLEQLDSFIGTLIAHNQQDYPIHIKLETGMNRLGFLPDQIEKLIRTVASQPEVRVQSIYSHLADSDNIDSDYTRQQIATFKQNSDRIVNALPYPVLRHILNSEGILNYPEGQFDMVRIGIGMYGITSNPHWKTQLRPAISWWSIVSQVREIQAGESVGYGRTFIAIKPTKIAVIPVGYADGYSRILSQGKGGVYIQNEFCPVVGNVCMDMIMVDVSAIDAIPGEPVEIIGPHQSIESLAKKMGTIPYEVMTRFSTRIHRVFTEK